MIRSHLFMLVLASGLISIVLGYLAKDEKKARRKFIIIMFTSMVLFCIIAAWIMYFFHD